MPRQPKIRWNTNQKERLKKTVKRFNAKIEREAKKSNIASEYLPKKLSIKELKQSITTAKDLNLLEKSVQRAFKKDAFKLIKNEKGVTTTKYEKREVGIQVRRINLKRSYERKKANLTFEKGNTYLEKELALKPKPFNFKDLDKRNWEKYKETTAKLSRASYRDERLEMYAENYKELARQNAPRVYELIKDLDAEEIYNARFDNPTLDIEFYYDPIDQEAKNEFILDAWQETLNDI